MDRAKLCFKSGLVVSLICYGFLLCDIVFANVGAQTELKGIISRFQDEIANLYPEYRDTIEDIQIRVPNIRDPSHVCASMDRNETKYIEISVGFGAINNEIAKAAVIELLFKKNGFVFDHIRYIAKNYHNEFSGKLLTAEDRAKLNQNQLNVLFENQRIGNLINGLRIAMFSHVISHEFAHHINGDLNNPTNNPDELVERENMADFWALETTAKLNIPPIGPIYTFLYWYFLYKEYPGISRAKTHPLEKDRMITTINYSITHFDSWYNTNHPAYSGQNKLRTKSQLESVFIKIKDYLYEN